MSITVVEVVSAGPQGIAGTSTQAGGLTSQVLMKTTDINYDVEWDYMAAVDVVFTSTEDVTAINVNEAIDEVAVRVLASEEQITANVAAINLNAVKITNVDTDLGVAYTAVTVEVESSDGTNAVIAAAVANGDAGVMTGVDKANLDINTAAIVAGELYKVVVNKSLIHVDTMLVPGKYYVDTGIPTTDGRLFITAFDDSAAIEQILYDSDSALVYRRTSATGAGGDWTAWVLMPTQIPNSIVSFLLLDHQPAQTMTPDTWEQLEWDANAVPFLEYGTDDLEFDTINKKILVKTAGIYRMEGLANLDATINDFIEIEVRVGGVSIDVTMNGIGRNGAGEDSPTSFPFVVVTPLGVNDDITIWSRTDGTEIHLHNISFTIEKLPY